MGKSVLNNGQIVDEERGKRTAVFVRFQSFIYNSPSVAFSHEEAQRVFGYISFENQYSLILT